ncbi:BTAD domain-containing putative transcriptional regulator [Solihabitans fulvus]|uniref:BTAD domain-containing putative transcriptional regulator n=1 Tax=Solihabitans fulvus TaxID=1892852 RepID=UPI001CB75E01|nr:BTAD domain-containing putative transcriptional regulator [Solihabitans fulvus]
MAGTIWFLGRLLRGLIAAVVLAALVVGLPWALVRYVGWPLPHHVPTWPELQGFLLAPMSVTFLLDFLACACWIVWFFFTLDVLHCTVEVVRDARWPDLSAAGPMHSLAGVLVGAVLLSVLGNNRPAPVPSGPPSGALGTGSPVVATAHAWQHSAFPSTFTVRQAVFTTSAMDTTVTDASTPAVSPPVSVIVRAPANGVYDSLWRIAQRTLGDGNRWPEIWHANEGKSQPGGRTFTQPSLIYPGQELSLPATATTPPAAPPVSAPPPAPDPTSPPPATSPSPTTPTSSASSLPTTPAPTTQHAPATGTGTPTSTREPGFRWEPDLFVGLGLAAAVSAALVIARRRYRARYQPGSGDRDDFPVAPVVYQLRLAHLRAEQDDDSDPDDDLDSTPSPRGAIPAVRVIGAPENGSDQDPALAARLGVRDGREIALNLAVARGLGLVGAGGPAATRALLVTALSVSNARQAGAAAGTGVLIPAEDLVPLLGRGAAHTRLPAALPVADSLEAALDALEAEILVRAGASPTSTGEPRSWPTLVLATTVPAHQRPRLQAVLDNGAQFGITGLLLGQWQPGVTAYIRADGTVSATSPGLGEALRGSQMFRLGEDDTAALLKLLHQADPEPAAPGEALAAPRPRPRVAPPATQSAPAPTRVAPERGDDVGSVLPISDTELEVIARAEPPVVTDTELEIIGPRPVHTPGVRLRPSPSLPEPVTSPEPSGRPSTTVGEVGQATSEGSAAPAAVGEAVSADGWPAMPVRVDVLGAPRMFWRPDTDMRDAREITGVFQPRTRELLVFLALHPDGASREALVAALWSDTPPERSTNSLNTAFSRLRRSVSAATGGALSEIVVAGENRYRLDPALVDVDFWHFDAAVAARRGAGTDQRRVGAYRAMVDSYGGTLADGMSTEWIETAREAIRRDAIDAVAALARALFADDPQQTLDLLEIARAFDPHNEALYRDIMRLQERLGLIDAIPRTLTLLTTRLAEVDNRPTEHAIGLATRLRQRHDDRPSAQPRAVTGGWT